MAEFKLGKMGRYKAYSLKLPIGPSANATMLVVSFLPRADLAEKDPADNARIFCNYLMALLDRPELTELKEELVRRLSKT